jgi:transcriptional regulator with GAF, ATPase, and Fis domain
MSIQETSQRIGIRHVSGGLGGMVGGSLAMKSLYENVESVARADVDVLITGESGTGKELVAKAIHELSPPAADGKEMLTVSCAEFNPELIESGLFGHERGAFSGAVEKKKGVFEQADKTTLFLDEIGEFPLYVQAKLLRVLQEREVRPVGAGAKVIKLDFRLLAATNRNLEREAAAGRFRADLLFRLRVVPIKIMPLRARREDIRDLVFYFMSKHSKNQQYRRIREIEREGLRQLREYDWPGNVRQLENIVQRLLTTCAEREMVTAEDVRLALDIEQGEASADESSKSEQQIDVVKKDNDAADEILDLDRESNRFTADLIKHLIAETGSIEAAARRLRTGSRPMTPNALRLRLWRAQRAAGINVTEVNKSTLDENGPRSFTQLSLI